MSGTGDEDVARIERPPRGRVVGPPSVESGQSHDENHVSSTSSSWRSGPPHLPGIPPDPRASASCPRARVAIPDRDPVSPPQLARDVPVADVLHPVDVHGRPSARAAMRTAPDRTASSAGAASGAIRTNHWSDSRGSTDRLAAVAVPHRVRCVLDPHQQRRRAQRSRRCVLGRRNGRVPRAPRGTRPAASSPLLHLPRPAFMTTGIGRPCRWPISKSFASCAGVIFSAPVPNAGSTAASAMIGISMPTIGSTDAWPIRSWYRDIVRMHRDATSPSIVSGRVVATINARAGLAGHRIPRRDTVRPSPRSCSASSSLKRGAGTAGTSG